MLLTIAGAGINNYSLVSLSNNIDWQNFDCIIASEKYNTETNLKLLPDTISTCFLPYNEIFQCIKQSILDNKKILYVVNGNPTFFSSMEILIKYLKQNISDFSQDNVQVISGLSSKDYLLSKLKIAENQVSSFSLHGKKVSKLDLTTFLSSKYTFVLCDEFSIEIINQNTKYVQEEIQVILASRLGSDNENIEIMDLSNFAEKYNYIEIKEKLMPYSLLIKRNYNLPSLISDDNEFKTRSGMITKVHKRFLSIEALKLFPNCTLWDIGAGSGSVSIDAYKIFKAQTTLFEKNNDQCAMITENLRNHKVLGCLLFENDFINVLPELTSADRIFIGGGGKAILSKLSIIMEKLNDQGILVANIIGLENLSTIIQEIIKTEYEYEIRNITVNTYKKMINYPDMNVLQPERPLFQIIIRK